MAKQKSKQKVTEPTPATSGSEPKKPAPNRAKPPLPKKKQDVVDIERADSEGMAQPQGLETKPKKTSAATKAPRKR